MTSLSPDRPGDSRPADHPMHQVFAAHLAWQQLFWHLPLALCSCSWLISRAAVADPAPAAPAAHRHDQLALPPEVAAEVEPALFA